MTRDLERAEQPDRAEPHDDHRAEEAADPAGAALLNSEQQDQQAERQRYHGRFERRGRDLEPLDRAQHRDRRRQDAIAIEQREPEQSSREDPAAAARPGGAQGQHGQRDDAALAAIVRPHQHDDVFDRDDEGQGPGDQRQDPENTRRGDALGGQQTLPDGIEGRGPDIAVDDAERGNRQALTDPRRGAGRNDGGIWHRKARSVRLANASPGKPDQSCCSRACMRNVRSSCIHGHPLG